ncbi:hypothetical protein SAMN05444396_11417 [Flavobacterium segetis]|uniref:Uncharacterized protein n=1 Tax=Flavobacterium segetis TaxID=271157 RepID=A0A1M5K0J1_9FLAO|nr:hypothetical protein [Flavobacterium segetis]SHG45813.1 hypothetical protein SAMN05444396_11417 [Flavobacterium segetis]
MERIKILIENIKNCNLSEEDKQTLLEKLENDNPDINGFLEAFILICKVSKEFLKLFDIDLWDS